MDSLPRGLWRSNDFAGGVSDVEMRVASGLDHPQNDASRYLYALARTWSVPHRGAALKRLHSIFETRPCVQY